MIRILHYIPGFLYGGIETVFLQWYENIDQTQFEFELLKRTQDCSEDLKKYIRMGGKYYILPSLQISRLHVFHNGVRDFFKKHNDYDILHVHTADPFVMYYAKKYGIPKVIVHSHTSKSDKGIKAMLNYVDEQIAMRFYADGFFACSKEAACWKFHGSVLKGKSVRIIHNAISCTEYAYDVKKRNEMRQKLKLAGSFVIGHVGRMSYPKNQIFLLKIFAKVWKQIPGAVLLLVGDGPDEEQLKVFAKKIGVESYVVFLGKRNDVSSLLQAMDVFLLPSRYEGLPVTLLEAQAAGVPCVISDVITHEIDISPLIHRISLERDAGYWADRVVEISRKKKRMDCSRQLVDAGFDTGMAIKNLQKNYEKILKIGIQK